MKKTMISALVLSAASLGLPAVAGFAPAYAAAPAVAGLPDFADLVERVGPAVVNIRTTERITQKDVDAAGQADEMQEFLRRFFGGQIPRGQGQTPRRRNLPSPGQEIQRGIGSGFVVSADGYVLTNAHVVDGADEVYVTLTDKREFKAKVLGADARADVAVLKIDSGKLPYLTIGDPNKARVGEWVACNGDGSRRSRPGTCQSSWSARSPSVARRRVAAKYSRRIWRSIEASLVCSHCSRRAQHCTS